MKKFLSICKKSTDGVKYHVCLMYLTSIFILLSLIPLRGLAQTDPEHVFEMTLQPVPITIVQKDGAATLSCVAAKGEEEISYQWYLHTDESDTKIVGATENSYTTEPFAEKGIKYYYCEAVCGDEGVTSDIVVVAYTGLATLYIETPEQVEITSKTDWLQTALLSLRNADDPTWNFDDVSMSIRGRGNSTWAQPKKPYALKLDKKREIMGMPAHKRWVLIANYLDNSFLKNHLAFYLSEQFEMNYTVKGKFVDLYFNGEYRGLYWFGEAIKVDKNRVNINDGNKNILDEEDKDYLIEMSIEYDEPVKFKSQIRQLPYMIKNDDYMIDEDKQLTNGGQARLSRLQEKINELEKQLYPDYEDGMSTKECSAPKESYTSVIDIDSWAKFWIINEIMDNGELGHPKSCYFTYESSDNFFEAGPVWDFDWATLEKSNSCSLQHKIYFDALFKSPTFVERTKSILEKYSHSIDIQGELENMKKYLTTASDLDKLRWGIHLDPSNIKRENFNEYVDFLSDAAENKKKVVENYISTRKIYQISYDLCDGFLSKTNPGIYTSDVNPFTLNNPERDGYVFAGWIGTGLDVLTESVTVTDDHLGNKKYTAVWRRNIDLCDISIENTVLNDDFFTPDFIVRDGNRILMYGIDYTISAPEDYSESNEYTVTFFGQGSYAGSVEKTFTISQFTPVSEIITHNNINIWSFEKTVLVENAESEIIIADMSGRIVNRLKPDSDRMEIQMSNDGIYIVKTGLATKKVLIR